MIFAGQTVGTASVACVREHDVLTAERARQVLTYDPKTGEFVHAYPVRGRGKGSRAGSRDRKGYVILSIDDVRYLAHRVAWLYVHGRWPAAYLDHINGDKSDNRLSNLREATKSQNGANAPAHKDNKSGQRGVFYNFHNGRWYARIQVNKKSIYIGCFRSKEAAAEAYQNAANKHFGAFARAQT